MMLKGAVFDADGTILDSMHIWRELGARFLRSLEVEPEADLATVLYPMSLEQSCIYLKQKYSLKLSEAEILRGILAVIEKFYAEEVKLKPGVKGFLECLKQNNIHMVIATSGDRNLLTSALKLNNINNYFTKIFTCSELNTTKHEPYIFLKCAEFLGLKPENIAVFDDALFAIDAAKSAGFVTFGVEDPSAVNDKQNIIDTADFYISDWRLINTMNYSSLFDSIIYYGGVN